MWLAVVAVVHRPFAVVAKVAKASFVVVAKVGVMNDTAMVIRNQRLGSPGHGRGHEWPAQHWEEKHADARQDPSIPPWHHRVCDG